MRNRSRDAVTLARVASAFDEDRNELGRALAVTHQRLRELDRDCGERGSYGRQPRIIIAFERSRSSASSCSIFSRRSLETLSFSFASA